MSGVNPMPDEREWTLYCRTQEDGVRVLEPPGSELGLGDKVIVVPKSSREAAEAELERQREALREYIYGGTGRWLESDVEPLIDALSPREASER